MPSALSLFQIQQYPPQNPKIAAVQISMASKVGTWLNNILINEGPGPKQSHLVGRSTSQEWGCFLPPSPVPGYLSSSRHHLQLTTEEP